MVGWVVRCVEMARRQPWKFARGDVVVESEVTLKGGGCSFRSGTNFQDESFVPSTVPSGYSHLSFYTPASNYFRFLKRESVKGEKLLQVSGWCFFFHYMFCFYYPCWAHGATLVKERQHAEYVYFLLLLVGSLTFVIPSSSKTNTSSSAILHKYTPVDLSFTMGD